MSRIFKVLITTLFLTGCAGKIANFNPNSHKYKPNDSNVIAFIGKKISVDEFDPNVGNDYLIMDLAFTAKYQVLEQLSGKPLSTTISFNAYDHYGIPKFSAYPEALIYVFEQEGVYFHFKYTFDQIKLSSENDWIKCGETLNSKGSRIIEPVFLWAGLECIIGNYAKNIVKARVESGQFNQ
jgi:hypothetical protein